MTRLDKNRVKSHCSIFMVKGKNNKRSEWPDLVKIKSNHLITLVPKEKLKKKWFWFQC